MLLGDAKLSPLFSAAWEQGLFSQTPEVQLGSPPEALKLTSENLCACLWKGCAFL